VGDCRRYLIEGRVKVEMTGHNKERFLNISSKRELLIEQVDQTHFLTSPKDFKKMKDVARKTGVRLRVRGRQGLPFFLYRNRKRKLLGIGAGVFLMLLYFSSFFIWDISYEGNRRFTDDMLFRYLETVPVYYGMRKANISCEELEAGIRNAFAEITWVSAEIKGTRLIIRIRENEVMMEPEVPDEAPCDLVAERGGTIKEIIVRKGISNVKIGDVVEKGTLLVDGTIPIYDDSEILVNSHEIHADADIYAETVHSFKKKIPLSRTEKVRTRFVRKGGYIRILENPFYLILPSGGEHLWEIVMEQNQVHLLEDFYLPIYYGGICAYEYDEYERYYTQEEVEAIGKEYLQEYEEKLSEKGIQILGSDGKIEFNESGWTFTGTMTVIENIAAEDRLTGKDEEN